MQSDRDLIKQALEALVLAQKDAQIAEADYAITALRERLAQPKQEQGPPQFPTMLRKMWSCGEVQKWINENWNKHGNR